MSSNYDSCRDSTLENDLEQARHHYSQRLLHQVSLKLMTVPNSKNRGKEPELCRKAVRISLNNGENNLLSPKKKKNTNTPRGKAKKQEKKKRRRKGKRRRTPKVKNKNGKRKRKQRTNKEEETHGNHGGPLTRQKKYRTNTQSE